MPTLKIDLAGVRIGPKPCRGCGANIYWVRTPWGKALPMDRIAPIGSPDDNGLLTVNNADTHWATCPNREAFKDRGRKA